MKDTLSARRPMIKVCGMRDGKNIRQVAELGVDMIGMIFWDKSPRNVTMIPTHAGIIPDRGSLPPTERREVGPRRVGVFVDEMPQNIITRVVNFGLDYIQLHGHESPTLIRNLRHTLDPDIRPGIKFIKAISVGSRDDIKACEDYADCVDLFLFDTKAPLPGGNGCHFDWSILDAYDGDIPFLLSGGIGPDDAERIRDLFADNAFGGRCIGIDLNSRFEVEPALKDVDKLRVFLNKVQNS